MPVIRRRESQSKRTKSFKLDDEKMVARLVTADFWIKEKGEGGLTVGTSLAVVDGQLLVKLWFKAPDREKPWVFYLEPEAAERFGAFLVNAGAHARVLRNRVRLVERYLELVRQRTNGKQRDTGGVPAEKSRENPEEVGGEEDVSLI